MYNKKWKLSKSINLNISNFFFSQEKSKKRNAFCHVFPFGWREEKKFFFSFIVLGVI